MWTERLASTTVIHGPYARHELSPGDQLAMTFNEGNKNIEGSTAERNALTRLQQEALLGKQAEAVKPDGRRRGGTSPCLGRWRRSACRLVIE